ncbi:hypothetical protein GOV14_06755 [Candidatus Pacearchaeota archaeon]|nr:hypothetical protein [Candidatus Pacearchaeota archaeon]
MIKYICTNCNYRFNAQEAIDCPYCGKEKIEKEKNATELLEEVEQILGN